MKSLGEKPDGGKTRITTVEAVERSRSVPVNGLVDGNSLRVPNDGVWWDRSGLIRILSHIVRNSDDWLVVLGHLLLFFHSFSCEFGI